jgi:hypothetical protein
MPLMIVGGLFANTDRLDPGFVWLNYISFPRYSFMALMVSQFRSVDTLCPASPVLGAGCTYRTGDDYLRYVGFESWKWWYSIFGLGGLSIVCLSIGSLVMTVLGLSRRGTLSFDFDSVGAGETERDAGPLSVPQEGEEMRAVAAH